jgi:predicted transcriptional regulator
MVVAYRAMSRPNIAWDCKEAGRKLILVGHSGLQPYNKAMEISLAPEVEAKLNQIASETGKGANQVVQELVANYLDHDEWFKREVKKGLSSLDDGKFVSHEEVRRQMERILSS